jgi:hypothetical protein
MEFLNPADFQIPVRPTGESAEEVMAAADFGVAPETAGRNESVIQAVALRSVTPERLAAIRPTAERMW